MTDKKPLGPAMQHGEDPREYGFSIIDRELNDALLEQLMPGPSGCDAFDACVQLACVSKLLNRFLKAGLGAGLPRRDVEYAAKVLMSASHVGSVIAHRHEEHARKAIAERLNSNIPKNEKGEPVVQ